MTAAHTTQTPSQPATVEESTALSIADAQRKINDAGAYHWLAVTLRATDLQLILDRLYSLCPEHEACEHCGAPICDLCGQDNSASCEHGNTLCVNCVEECDHCARERFSDRHDFAHPRPGALR